LDGPNADKVFKDENDEEPYPAHWSCRAIFFSAAFFAFLGFLYSFMYFVFLFPRCDKRVRYVATME
jgi:hypothetical protein